MRTNKFFLASAGFIGGIVFTIAVIGFYAFTADPPAPGGIPGMITASAANASFKKYMAGAVPYNAVIKGFAVDKSQVDAMVNINKENPALVNFRIYFGQDMESKPVSIVVGVDSKGVDAVTNSIYTTSAPGNPCPTVCDKTSPITKD